MKRITTQEVLEAYEKTGLKPMQGDYFPKYGCACGLGAFFRFNRPQATEGNVDCFYEGQSYNWHYINGFAGGFDGSKTTYKNEKSTTTEIGMLGEIDGKSAWEAVKHLAEETNT